MFADDSLLFNKFCISSSDHGDLPCCDLQVDASSSQDWADQWSSIFNPTKSCHIVFGRSSPQTFSPDSIRLKDIPVPLVSSTRHLGLHLASNLKWSTHVENLTKNVSWKFALLKRLYFRCQLSLSTLSRVYTTLVRPCLEYASAVWDNCSSLDSHSLEKLQLSLARSVLRAHCSFSSTSKANLLQLMGWQTLAWRRRRSKLLLFWKLANGKGPPSLSSKLASASSRCNYNLRNPSSVQVQLCSSSAHLSSFLPSTSVLWNSLPASITASSTVSSFKKSLDIHFAPDSFSFGLPP